MSPEGSERAFDVIIVLGAALGPDGRLGPALERRVLAGVAAYHRGLASRLIMTGAREAAAMRDRAVELGVPAAAILLEPTALTTRENALRSTAIVRGLGLARALVTTQRYHLRRALAAFRRAGLDVDGLEAAGPTPLRQRAREYVALAIYAARGWLQF